MRRQTPSSLRKLSTQAVERKRKTLERERRLALAEKEAAAAQVESSRSAKREVNELLGRILLAEMSSQHELEIRNPTPAQLAYLVHKGIDHGPSETVKKAEMDLRAEIKKLTNKLIKSAEKVDQLEAQWNDDIEDLDEAVAEWLYVYETIAYRAHLEHWFGADFVESKFVDVTVAEELLNFLDGEISGSSEPLQAQALSSLRMLIGRQVLAYRTSSKSIGKLQDQIVTYFDERNSLEERLEQLAAEEDVVYWVNWGNAISQPNHSGDRDISLLKWVSDQGRTTGLRLVDKALMQKASAGETALMFAVIDESGSYDKSYSTSNFCHRYECDGQVVLKHGPDAERFCLVMQAAGYKAKNKRQPSGIRQVTVSW